MPCLLYTSESSDPLLLAEWQTGLPEPLGKQNLSFNHFNDAHSLCVRNFLLCLPLLLLSISQWVEWPLKTAGPYHYQQFATTAARLSIRSCHNCFYNSPNPLPWSNTRLLNHCPLQRVLFIIGWPKAGLRHSKNLSSPQYILHFLQCYRHHYPQMYSRITKVSPAGLSRRFSLIWSSP